MFVLMRAVAYASVFVGFVLVFLPARVLAWSGIRRPPTVGPVEIGGIVVTALGAALTLWCVLAFALIGKGTPAPFDPPRRLVVRGPYQYVRNPMYIGAGTALLGAALFYRSVALLGFTAGFVIVTHLFILAYEEPTLRQLFGAEYQAYCNTVRRWLPRR